MNLTHRPARRLAAAAMLLAATSVVACVQAPAAHAETLTVAPAGTFVVELRGNGHGHGMSQYGARGAAIAGKTYSQILAFYYPGTKLGTVSVPSVRVRLSGVGSTLTVWAAPDLALSGFAGVLPSTNVRRYRLIAGPKRGMILQRLGTAPGSAWTDVRSGIPSGAAFHRTSFAALRVRRTDNTSTYYYGYLKAWRVNPSGSAGGVYTVDRLSWNRYTQGVVPREVPTMWERPAVNAQAVAARTYAAYSAAHPMASTYDICDTTQCQVYGGHLHVDAAGTMLWEDYPPAARDTSNQILTLQGEPIFAQFSASSGGWTVDGGQPYLIAQADIYDTAAASDPYLGYKRTISVATIAKAYGLAKVTEIAVTKRDGHGLWHGRMLAGYVKGTDAKGAAKTVPTTGSGFAGVLGVGTTWLRLLPA